MPASQVQYDFGYGERHEYAVIAAQDIEQFAQPIAGLYSWHYRLSQTTPNRSADMTTYDSIYAAKSYDIFAQAHLGERLTGKITRAPFTNSRAPEFSRATLAASTIFCPPLYIGISTNIKGRLSTHYNALVNFLARPINLISYVSGEPEDDTEAESSIFAERIGSLLKQNNVSNPGRLFVKVVYVQGATKRELEQAEFFVNRTFIPLYGRR